MFIITTKRLFCIALMLVSTCKLFAADPNAWEQLNLNSTSIAGATVYYEKSFEPKLPIFEREYKKFLAEKESGKAINAKKNQIFADINQILGITKPDIEMQDKLWTGFLGVFSLEKTTFYIVKQNTTKDFLRAGGQLPNFTYDKASDTATYKPEFKTTSKDGPIKDFELVFHIDTKEGFERSVDKHLQWLTRTFGIMTVGLTVHEVTEVSLFLRVEPKDPYWRWFCDGVANVIADEIVKKYGGRERAEELAAGHDVSRYKDYENEINLQYWMSLTSCIEAPVEYERNLKFARYAYATLEVQRMVDKHGLNCIGKILDEVCRGRSRTSQDLMQAIKKVTGVDMQHRLCRYQDFQTREEGLDKYAAFFKAAARRKDLERMLINRLRMFELQGSQFTQQSLDLATESAVLLFKLGHEETGDELMQNCLEIVRSSGVDKAHKAGMEMFVIYALCCGKPDKAEKMAQKLLKVSPDHVPSLTVQMLVHAEAGKLAEAKQIAKRIVNLTDKQSQSYKDASRILAIDPNQPWLRK